MHLGHPDYEGLVAFAHVVSRGNLAELSRFSVLVSDVELGDTDLAELGQYLNRAGRPDLGASAGEEL